jgi:hypothetical protein
MKRSLDKRIKLTFDLETPACVLLEAAWSLGINADENLIKTNEMYRSSVLATMKKLEPRFVAEPYSESDLSYIALFVNPNGDIEWEEETLIKAFDYTYRLHEHINTIESYTYGYPTPKNTKSASSVYLYRYLISKNIRTRYDYTMNDMIKIVDGFNYKRDYLYTNVCAQLALCDRNTLVQLFGSLRPDLSNKKPNEKKLKEAFDCSKHYKQPKSNEEAIVLAATEFRKDISSFPVPTLAYFELVNSQFSSSPYERKLLNVNEHIYDIGSRFNPSFPMQVYLAEELKMMCDQVGVKKYTKMERNYEQLVSYYLVDTFHYGIIPGVPLETPIQNEDITNYDFKNIVSYGSFGGSFVAYTVEELVYMFEANDFFYDPIGGIYTADAIRSLELIAKRMKHRTLWKQLLAIMQLLKRKANDIEFHKESFSSYYNGLPAPSQLRLKQNLKGVMKLGLIFRGWKKGQTWPINWVPSYDTIEASFAAVAPLRKFLDKIDLNNDVDKKLFGLPLIKVEAKTHTLIMNNDISDGLTLGQRLKIVEERKELASCIRTSSSYLLATSFVFLKAIKVPIQQESDFQRIKIAL